jgi:hypothetical protein
MNRYTGLYIGHTEAYVGLHTGAYVWVSMVCLLHQWLTLNHWAHDG